jgi:hypothetical protein
VRRNVFWTLLVVASGIRASAGAITIANPSFESPVQPPGSFNVGTVAGWTSTGDSGVFHPIIGSEFNSIPDGLQTGYSNGGALSQILSTTLVTSTAYTLQVDVGKRLDCCAGFGPIIQLWAGSTLLATATNVGPTAGNFLTETLSYTSTSSDPQAGQALRIVLDSTGGQTDFDNVRLDGTAVTISPTPEPASIALLGVGIVALLVRKRMAE